MANAILWGMSDAGDPHVRYDEGEVASAKPRRGSLLCQKTVLMLMFASMACTVLAKVVGTSAKSYFLDTRQPIVALSGPGELDTTPTGLSIIFR